MPCGPVLSLRAVSMRRSLEMNCGLMPLASFHVKNRSNPLCRNRLIIHKLLAYRSAMLNRQFQFIMPMSRGEAMGWQPHPFSTCFSRTSVSSPRR